MKNENRMTVPILKKIIDDYKRSISEATGGTRIELIRMAEVEMKAVEKNNWLQKHIDPFLEWLGQEETRIATTDNEFGEKCTLCIELLKEPFLRGDKQQLEDDIRRYRKQLRKALSSVTTQSKRALAMCDYEAFLAWTGKAREMIIASNEIPSLTIYKKAVTVASQELWTQKDIKILDTVYTEQKTHLIVACQMRGLSPDEIDGCVDLYRKWYKDYRYKQVRRFLS